MATKGGNNTGRHKQTERGGAALKNKCTKNKTRKNAASQCGGFI